MPAERKDSPVTEMFIQSDENSFITDRFLQYLIIICSSLTNFGGTQNVMTIIAQSLSNVQP